MHEALIERLVSARTPGAPRVPADSVLEGEMDAAYRVQSAVAARLGPVGGYKCGRRASDAVPKFAPVFASDVYPHGGHLAPSAAIARSVELELGFRLLAEPPAPDASDFEGRLRAGVEAVPVLEIIGSRFDVPAEAGEWSQLADNLNNDAIVVGRRSDELAARALDRFELSLEIGGQVVHDGPAIAAGGDAFRTFAAFVRVVGSHAGGLQPGQVVITGALSGPHDFGAGDRVLGRIAGIGEVSVHVAA